MGIKLFGSGNNVSAGYSDLGGANWVIGWWGRNAEIGALSAGGIMMQVSANVATYSSGATNIPLTVVDTGNSDAVLVNRKKYIMSGRDNASNPMGPGSYSFAGGTLNGVRGTRQYETYDPTDILFICQCVSGVRELWTVRKGCAPYKECSSSTTWTAAAKQSTTFGLNRGQVVGQYAGSIDAPFHMSDKSLTVDEMVQISNGVSPQSLAQSARFGRAAISFRSITTNSGADAIATYWPAAGAVLTLNGVGFTVVASGATGNQINRGTDLTTFLANAVAVLNASSDPAINIASYVAFGDCMYITHKTAGPTAANAYTVGALPMVNGNCRGPLSGHLDFCEYEYPRLASNTYTLATYGGGQTAVRQQYGTWYSQDIAPLPVASFQAVAINGMVNGRVMQHIGGVCNIPVSGLYSGAVPTGVLVEVRNLADDSVVLAETAVTSFTATGGAWSGILPGVPKGKRWLSLRMRKTGATDYSQTQVAVGVGENVEIAGQSWGVIWATDGAAGQLSNGFVGHYMSDSYIDTSNYGQWAPDACWHRDRTITEGRFVANKFATAISEARDCVVGIFNRSVGATAIAVIDGAAQWTARVNDLNTSGALGIPWFIWIHGHADQGSATYKADLDTLLGHVRQYYGASANFGLQLLGNTTASVYNTTAFYQTRKDQDDWLKAKVQVDANVFSAGQTTDMLLPSDGIHPYGATEAPKMADRAARGVLYKMGLSAISADGPLPISLTRSGAVLDLTFAMQGGATLRTIDGSDPTGFDVSKDNFATILPISTVKIVAPNKVRITLASDPGQEVGLFHLWGRPGKYGASDASITRTTEYTTAQAYPLLDDTTSLIGAAAGRPAQGNYTVLTSGASAATQRGSPLLAILR